MQALSPLQVCDVRLSHRLRYFSRHVFSHAFCKQLNAIANTGSDAMLQIVELQCNLPGPQMCLHKLHS